MFIAGYIRSARHYPPQYFGINCEETRKSSAFFQSAKQRSPQIRNAGKLNSLCFQRGYKSANKGRASLVSIFGKPTADFVNSGNKISFLKIFGNFNFQLMDRNKSNFLVSIHKFAKNMMWEWMKEHFYYFAFNFSLGRSELDCRIQGQYELTINAFTSFTSVQSKINMPYDL